MRPFLVQHFKTTVIEKSKMSADMLLAMDTAQHGDTLAGPKPVFFPESLQYLIMFVTLLCIRGHKIPIIPVLCILVISMHLVYTVPLGNYVADRAAQGFAACKTVLTVNNFKTFIYNNNGNEILLAN
jgi:hypothetical protein